MNIHRICVEFEFPSNFSFIFIFNDNIIITGYVDEIRFFRHIARHIGRHLENDDFVAVEFSSNEFPDPQNIGFDTLFLMIAQL